MIKTPLSTVIGGAFWTPGATVIGGNAPTFDQQIQKLFANNEQGFFYDTNDLSTMFQDAAGTVPVTGEGQTVGLMLDKSGRNNHASQNDSARRPILRKNAVTGANYLAFDGVDDFLQTSNVDFTSTDKVSLFVGVRKLSDVSAQILVELSADQTANSGSFVLMPRQTGMVEGASFRSRGSLYNSILNVAGLKAPLSTVFTAKADIQGDSSILRSNGVQVGELNANQGTGNYGNYPLYIGRRGGTSLPFNGHLYSLIGIGKLTTDDETTAIEKELAKRVGVTLNV